MGDHFDPWRRMAQLTDQVYADLAQLRAVAEHPDPDTADRRPSTRVSTSGGGPSDPTLAKLTTATTTRLGLLDELLKILTSTAHHVEDPPVGLFQLCDRYDVPRPATRPAVERLAARPHSERTDEQGPHLQAIQCFRSAWTSLHVYVVGADYDIAVDVVLTTGQTQHNPNPIANRLRRLARRARTAIIQPDHAAAGTNRVSCSDPLNRGCRRFLAVGRRYGQCKQCDNEKQRRRRQGATR